MAQRFWRIPKKESKWVVSPSPGPHKKFESIPLLIIIRDLLKLAEIAKEARAIIKTGEILVDGKKRKSVTYPAGLFDVVSIPKLGKHYRVVPTQLGLELIEISEDEAKVKICNIKDKTKIKGNKIQLNLHDGKNILVDKDIYRTQDTVLVELNPLKIVDHVKTEKGSIGILTRGANRGELGKIKEVIPGKFKSPSRIICEIGEKEVEILNEHFFAVGKDKPIIRVSG